MNIYYRLTNDEIVNTPSIDIIDFIKSCNKALIIRGVSARSVEAKETIYYNINLLKKLRPEYFV